MTVSDTKIRCGWVGNKPHLVRYHDEEWGVPAHDDRKHFEMLLLEGAQAGLAWERFYCVEKDTEKPSPGLIPAKLPLSHLGRRLR
jgi:DNA-3-methyladenine glycosylase I